MRGTSDCVASCKPCWLLGNLGRLLGADANPMMPGAAVVKKGHESGNALYYSIGQACNDSLSDSHVVNCLVSAPGLGLCTLH